MKPPIPRPFSITLDLLRGLAALAVLLGHAVRLGLYTGPWPFDRTFEHSAVILFFVLSGYVVHMSTIGAGRTLRDYAVARATRILPVAFFAILLSSSLYHQFGASWAITAPRQLIGDENIVWPLLFLSEAPWHLTPAANPPYWSLCYEVWFYALFGAWFFLRGRTRILATIAIALCAGVGILLLMPVWLMGAAVSAHAPALPRRRSTVAALLLALLIFVALPASGETMAGAEWLEAIGIAGLRHTQFLLTDWPMGACVAAMLVCLRALLPAESARRAAIERPVRRFAAMSFTLYLLHWPILSTMHTLGWDAGTSPVRLAAVLLVPLAIAFILSRPLEQTIPAALRRLLRRRAASMPATCVPGAQTL